jgi:Zn-dependent protease with chaperone function
MIVKAEQQISFLDIFRFFIAFRIYVSIAIFLEGFIDLIELDTIAEILIVLSVGSAGIVFLGILVALVIVSWRYKLIAGMWLLFLDLWVRIKTLPSTLDSWLVFIFWVISISFVYIGGSLAITIWQVIKNSIKLKTKKPAESIRLKPKLSLILIGLSILSVPIAFFALILSSFVILTLSLIGAYFLLQADSVPYALIFAVAIAPLIGIYASIRSIALMFFHKPHWESAKSLDVSKYPKLKEAINEVCQKVKTKPPTTVLLHAEPTFFVTQGKIETFDGIVGGRVLAIGSPMLSELNDVELKSILSHEFAHFSGRDTMYSSIVAPVYRGISTAVKTLDSTTSGKVEGLFGLALILLVAPSKYFLKQFFSYFAQIDMILSRSRELRCDLIASEAYGASAFSSALSKTVSVGMHFGDHSYDIAVKSKDNFFAEYSNVLKTAESKLEEYKNKALEEKGDELDSHPTLGFRLNNIHDPGLPQAEHADQLIKEEISSEQNSLSVSYTDYANKFKPIMDVLNRRQKIAVRMGEGKNWLLVTGVLPNSVASKFGINTEDLILLVNNQFVSTIQELKDLLKKHLDGVKFPIVVLRRENDESVERVIDVELASEESLGVNLKSIKI